MTKKQTFLSGTAFYFATQVHTKFRFLAVGSSYFLIRKRPEDIDFTFLGRIENITEFSFMCKMESPFTDKTISECIAFEEIVFLDTSTEKPDTWTYKWVSIDASLWEYVRYRMEDTLDGFQKPYTEVVAYVHNIGLASWKWRAYRRVGQMIEDIDISSSLILGIQRRVEEYLAQTDGKH